MATSYDSLIQNLLSNFQQQTDKANQANEARYADILNLFKDRHTNLGNAFQSSLSNLETMGQNAIADIQRQTASRQGATSQSLIDRGLFNSTVLDALQRRNVEEGNRATADIQERVAMQKSGLMERMGLGLDSILGDQAGFMERRTDLAPNFSDLIPLLLQYGQSQADRPGIGKSHAFLGINRGSGGGMDSGMGGGSGGISSLVGGGVGGGHSLGSSVTTVRNTGPANDPFANQTIDQLQSTVQGRVNNNQSDGLPTIPRTVYFQNPAYRVQGDFVYSTQTGQLVGRRGN